MEDLFQFCSECIPLINNNQVENLDNKRRVRTIAAMFLGMKDNVHRVMQAASNGSCAITSRMENWVSDTIQDARTLVETLQERPRELGFFARGFLGFCAASSDPNEEANERRMTERVNSVLSRVFVIQAAIHYEEPTVVIDIQADTSVDSARQEFLGCVYDFNKRLGVEISASEEGFKLLLSQISKEYQKRQDERTEAGKRAFIRWHKAANDMIKTQLQQKLSEHESELVEKAQKIEDALIEMRAIEQRNKELEMQLQGRDNQIRKDSLTEITNLNTQLASLRSENAELKGQLDGKAEIEALLVAKEKSEIELNTQLTGQKSENEKLKAFKAETEALLVAKEKSEIELNAQLSDQKSENERLKTVHNDAQQKLKDIEMQLNERKHSEEKALNEIVILTEQLESSKDTNMSANAKIVSFEKELAEKVTEITVLKKQLSAAENHKANGISNLNSLQKQLLAKEEELQNLQKEATEKEDELEDLRTKISTYKTEQSAMTDTLNKKTAELQAAQAATQQKENKYQLLEAEMKALREQLKEKQDEVVHLLESNVELEETCRGFQQRISSKEEDIMKIEQQLAEMDEETKRTIREKTEAIESLEKKVKRLTHNLDNAKKDLKSTKTELEEMRNKAQ
eukprot:g1757.t1